MRNSSAVNKLNDSIQERIAQPPLSKYGIDMSVSVVSTDQMKAPLRRWTASGGMWREITRGQFFWYRKKIPKNQTGDYLLNTDVEHSKILSILSEIAVRVEGPLTKP